MTATLEMVVYPGLVLKLSEDSVAELSQAYGYLGGSPQWLGQAIKDGVKHTENAAGVHVVTSALDGEVISDTTEPESEPSDPWGVDRGTPEPSSSLPVRQESGSGGTTGQASVRTETDKFGRQWTIGLPDAPHCYCGEQAARMKAKSQKGKPYTVWKCARGQGSNWQNKCEFSEFPH